MKYIFPVLIFGGLAYLISANLLFYLCLQIGVIVVVVVGVLLLLRRYIQQYYRSFCSAIPEKGIDDLTCIDVDGTQQWLHIRGNNRDNPILLFLHGGPGVTHIGWFDEVQWSWEGHFTVVQWDQRQVGKSYLPLKSFGATVTNQRMIEDTEEVIQYLLTRFNQPKLFLMGTSYGSYLGMHIAKCHPDWLYAYVGIGQMVAMEEHAQLEHAQLLRFAVDTKDIELENKLKAMEPFPDPEATTLSFFSNVGFMLDLESRLGKCYPRNLKALAAGIAICHWLSPNYSLIDLWRKYVGDKPAVQDLGLGFADEFMGIDLPKEVGNHFDVPIFFFLGKDDWHISAESSAGWFDQIRAPFKESVLFHNSAHAPYLTEPGEFLIALVQKVLPQSKAQ